MTQPYDLSPELVQWVSRYKKDVLSKLQTGSLKVEQGKDQFMKRIIQSPQFLSEAWLELIQIMEELKAPPDVLSEAREVAPVLSSNLTGKTLSDAEQVELSALVQPLETATDNEKLSILQEAIQQGKLSKRLADKTIRLVPNIDPYKGSTDSEPGIPMMRFSWGACGFCGALGFAEGGPLGGAAACVFCGVLAE